MRDIRKPKKGQPNALVFYRISALDIVRCGQRRTIIAIAKTVQDLLAVVRPNFVSDLSCASQNVHHAHKHNYISRFAATLSGKLEPLCTNLQLFTLSTSLPVARPQPRSVQSVEDWDRNTISPKAWRDMIWLYDGPYLLGALCLAEVWHGYAPRNVLDVFVRGWTRQSRRRFPSPTRQIYPSAKVSVKNRYISGGVQIRSLIPQDYL